MQGTQLVGHLGGTVLSEAAFRVQDNHRHFAYSIYWNFPKMSGPRAYMKSAFIFMQITCKSRHPGSAGGRHRCSYSSLEGGRRVCSTAGGTRHPPPRATGWETEEGSPSISEQTWVRCLLHQELCKWLSPGRAPSRQEGGRLADVPRCL